MQMNNEKTILLVEDKKDDVDLLKIKFRSREIECNMPVVSNGKEALDYMHHVGEYSDREKYPDPDLIILDIRMPKMSGIEFLNIIKSDEKMRNIPVIMLTISTLEKDIFDSFDACCEHYVAKSVAFELFEETIEPIIRFYLNK